MSEFNTHGSGKPPAHTSSVSVLIVDDSRDLVEVLRMVVNAEGDLHSVGAAFDGADMLQAIEQLRPQVAVVDLTMPGPAPLDAIREASRRFPQTRCIAYSGYDDPRTVEQARQAGAWGFVSKHGEISEIASAVRRVARGEPAF